MMKKISFVLIIVLLASSVFAITGGLGNARMILRTEPGEDVQRNILIRNVNEVPLNISLSVTGDLKDNLEIDGEKDFEIQSGEDRKVYFTIYSDEEGTFETKINVQFTPENGNGVGLSSNIIMIVGEGENDNTNDEDDDFVPIADENDDEEGEEGFDLKWLLLISPIVLLIILIVLISLIKKRKTKTKKSARK